MKQFQYTTNLGETSPVQTFEELATALDPETNACLARLRIGGRLRMRIGYWTRLPDLVDAEMEMESQHAERLERIATAAMAAIIGKLPLVTTHENDLSAQNMRDATAVGAVGYAKALIAELDKQA